MLMKSNSKLINKCQVGCKNKLKQPENGIAKTSKKQLCVCVGTAVHSHKHFFRCIQMTQDFYSMFGKMF